MNSGVAISGYPNSGFVRSLGYEGFDAGFSGFLLWSGSALPGQNTKGGGPYTGVGLELYANTSSYFRYSTTDSEIDVRTNKFFFGNSGSIFISGANGNIQISSSNFNLSPQGNVTASSFIAITGSTIMLDTNSGFADGKNIGRHIDHQLGLFTGTAATTASIGTDIITVIKPGETTLQILSAFQLSGGPATGRVLIGIAPLTGYNSYGTMEYRTAFSFTSVGSTFSAGVTGEVDLENDYSSNYSLGAVVKIRVALWSNVGTMRISDFCIETARTLGVYV